MSGLTFSTRAGGIATAVATPLIALVSLGCSDAITTMAADTTAGVYHRAAPAFEQHWDYKTVGDAFPATIMQLEGVGRVVPENEQLIVQLVRSYVAYAYGWVEDEAERFTIEGDSAAAEDANIRARMMYTRAKDLGLHRLRLEDDGVDAALRGGIEELELWLEESFDDEEDAEALFWTGYAWASYINLSLSDISAVGNLSRAKAFVARSVELDPTYYHASGLAFLGAVECQELSGDMDKARQMFEQALAKTERKALIVQLNMARYYATKMGDRELFVQLLEEIRDAGNPLPEARLNNVIAQRRAARMLEQVDELF